MTIERDISRILQRRIKKKADITKVSKSKLTSVGKRFINDMKKEIKIGKSPITGKKFPAYKNPANYPGKVRKKFPNKRDKPVNLKLSGKFLRDLDVIVEKAEDIVRLRIGYFTDLSSKKESGHARGVNGQPRRPTIPARNQNFSIDLLKKLKNSFISILEQQVKK